MGGSPKIQGGREGEKPNAKFEGKKTQPKIAGEEGNPQNSRRNEGIYFNGKQKAPNKKKKLMPLETQTFESGKPTQFKWGKPVKIRRGEKKIPQNSRRDRHETPESAEEIPKFYGRKNARFWEGRKTSFW